MISIFLHETFRTGLVFLSWLKWVQTVVCYDQNLQNHKYLSTDINASARNLQNRACFFWASRNESKQWYAMIKTYKNINISARYQCFCTKPSEQGLFFQAGWNESKQWYAMIKTYKNINISARYQYFYTKPSEQGFFLRWSKWVQTVVCYDQNLQNHKYLSMISIFLHETFRTGLVFPNQSKWVQTVVCYDQNLQKHKYLSMISMLLHKFFRTGHFSEPVKMSPNSGMLWSKLTKS